MARLFDMDPLTAWPADLPLPYSSENPPTLVRVIVILIILQPVTNIFCWLAIQDLYPNREVDAELSDEDNIRQKKPAGDDAEGKGAPSVEALAPNPIGSSLAGSPALQLPIRLPPPLHLPLEKGKSVLRSGLSASKTKLQPIR
jgi:hypothetical protein